MTRYKRATHWLSAGMQTGVMHCNISENCMTFCRHVDHKRYYKVITNQRIVQASLAVGFWSSLQLTPKNVLSKHYNTDLIYY